MAGTADFKAIIKKVKLSKEFRAVADELVSEKVGKAKDELLSEFDAHPVTQEIMAGPDAKNITNTLGGYGNLFSFIGFDANDRPVAKLRELLKSSVKVGKGKIPRNNLAQINYSITIPSMRDLEFATPMPWEGRSWIKAIEQGMSGFGFYMFKEFNKGRSGMGLQAENKIRSGGHKNVKYISEILNNFNKNLRSSIK